MSTSDFVSESEQISHDVKNALNLLNAQAYRIRKQLKAAGVTDQQIPDEIEKQVSVIARMLDIWVKKVRTMNGIG